MEAVEQRLFLANWIPFASTVYFSGMMLSGVIIPVLSDIKGRRIVLLSSILFTGILMITIGFSPSILFLTCCLFVTGFGFASIEIMTLVYSSEISGTRFRNHSIVALVTVWGFSQVVLGFIFTFLSNWRYIFVFVIGVPLVLLFGAAIVLFDETPRYLVNGLMFDEAKIVLKRMAHINRRPPFMFKFNREMEFDNENFYCIKRDDRESINDVMSPVAKYIRKTFNTEWEEKLELEKKKKAKAFSL